MKLGILESSAHTREDSTKRDQLQCLAQYLSAPEDWHSARAKLDRALGGQVCLESTRSGDGEHTRYAEVSRYPIRTSKDEIIGVSVFARDVSERRRSEAERERLTRAIEQAAEMIFVTDAEGAFVYVNPAFEAVTGYTRAEVLGLSPRILKSGVHDREVYRSLWHTIRSGSTWQGRLVNQRKNGSRFTVEATISPVRDSSGVLTSYVAVQRDITNDLALQAQFLQSQKMEGIGRLAGGVAHDFNNLLSVILSYTSFALDDAPEGAPLRSDLLEIQKAGERAASLTRQLLAFSRKQVLQPETLDLNRVATEMEKMLRRILGEDIDLKLLLAPDLGFVKADPGQIEQVIMNLVVNARDAMPEGGRITVETANVVLDQDHPALYREMVPGPYVMFSIADSGFGMDAGTMARIFEPFFTTKGPGKGTGLGLSTVYGIVRQSGGNIKVYSELGKGTTFKVYVPRDLSGATATAIKTQPAQRRATGNETILVVEDEEALRSVTRRTLESAGYVVLTAASGDEALTASARQVGTIHLLLTDVVMPRMSGRELAEKLLVARPALKVLYTSGYTDDAIVHHGMLDAGTHFIGKPFNRSDLVRKVQEVLEGGIAAPEPRHVQLTEPTDDAVRGRALEKDALRGVPADLLDRLHTAVVSARYDDMIAIVGTIQTMQPEVAAGLRRMLDGFDYAGLRDLLRE